MDEKSLYAHILNLTAPWQVKSLSLDENAGSVTVTVGIAENARLACPTCGKSCSVHDHRHRKWRHLDTCQFTTIVEADVPRFMCPEHCCQTLPVPWAGPGSRYTLLFESFVLSWLKISTVDAVRKQLKLSWNAVDGIMTRAVKRALVWIKKPLSARHMNVNEVAFKKGHRYITVISDLDGRALALTDDRGTESLAGYLRTLTDGQLLAIKTLSMDMIAGYIRAARIHLPCAVEKIAFDRFHVAKQLGEVVDKTRQNEHPHLPVESRRQAKGPRFLWQYSDKWMTESRQEKLIWLRAQMKLTSQCWALKELAKDIWNRPWSEERRNDRERWLALAANSDVPMMKNAAKTIGKRLYGILNAMRHRVSNGNAEALNSKIKLLRIKVMRYRNRERFKPGLMFHYGKLNMAF
ncbi:ISL3 family transposase [Escherichia coli]|nr:ISL3 family transposase [Escherichia coli]EFA4512793.1 ISL3 family transposase [Escherichia coli]EFA4550523.1 ISL3 family transposase [Escherichia coli]EHF5553442.1 ISL3 family transposase [Escherichia coli]EHF8358725.1 ISL3 family transposase [Escherichia coli]